MVFIVVAVGGFLALQSIVVSSTLMGREVGLEWNLLDYQISKIHNSSPDVVFVGDSSLGNAIRASEWERLGGGKALNLALTGSFGFEGSRNMVKRVLAKTRPKLIVVVQTSNMIQRAPSLDGDRATEIGLKRFMLYVERSLSWKEFMQSYYFWRSTLAGQRPFTRYDARTAIVDDYIEQRPQAKHRFESFISAFDEPQWIRGIRKDTVKIVGDIAAICREHGAKCVYAHGPLAEPACRAPEYFGKVSGMIRKAGLPVLLDHAMCMSIDEIGDGEDHVGLHAKAAFTRRYLEIARPYLQN